MNPLDARESNETYEYPARPYTLPMRPVQSFRVLSESGDVPAAQEPEPYPEDLDYSADEVWCVNEARGLMSGREDRPWMDGYLTAEDARVLRQDGM